ncbi:MAG: replicative DNA helicase [Acidobacteriota bacterium]
MIDTLQHPAPKALPFSEEAERAVLAAVLLDPPLLAVMAGRLVVEDFYLDRHQLIYQGMIDLQAAQSPIDLRTLQARLEQRAVFDNVGGVAYLATLDLDLPDLGRIDTYVELVKERSLRRRLIRACGEITRDCLDGGVDAAQALGRAEEAILTLGEEAIPRGFESIGKVFATTLEDLEERSPSAMVGVPSGFIDFDEMTRGLNPSNLIIVAGRPGMGKTSLAMNIAQNVAVREKKSVAVYSLEMSKHELALRVLASESDVEFRSLRTGHMSQKQWGRVIQTVKAMSGTLLFIDDSANPTLLEVASKARRLKADKGLDLIILDYLQLMQAGGRYENRNLEIAAITRGLKQLAKELAVPVIALSQLSRAPERRGADHRPQLSDLRESGAIEQDADIVAFVYRDEVYNAADDNSNRGLAELIVAKHRNGITGTIQLVFQGETTSFRNRAKFDGPGPGPGSY